MKGMFGALSIDPTSEKENAVLEVAKPTGINGMTLYNWKNRQRAHGTKDEEEYFYGLVKLCHPGRF